MLELWMNINDFFSWNGIIILLGLFASYETLGLDVSRCQTCVVFDPDTYNYIELCDFLKLLVVSVSVSYPLSVSVFVLHSLQGIFFFVFFEVKINNGFCVSSFNLGVKFVSFLFFCVMLQFFLFVLWADLIVVRLV